MALTITTTVLENNTTELHFGCFNIAFFIITILLCSALYYNYQQNKDKEKYIINWLFKSIVLIFVIGLNFLAYYFPLLINGSEIPAILKILGSVSTVFIAILGLTIAWIRTKTTQQQLNDTNTNHRMDFYAQRFDKSLEYLKDSIDDTDPETLEIKRTSLESAIYIMADLIKEKEYQNKITSIISAYILTIIRARNNPDPNELTVISFITKELGNAINEYKQNNNHEIIKKIIINDNMQYVHMEFNVLNIYLMHCELNELSIANLIPNSVLYLDHSILNNLALNSTDIGRISAQYTKFNHFDFAENGGVIDLNDANLTGAGLIDANLTGAGLIDANLTDTNLTDADLTDANLTGANLTNANLTDANLTDANLISANLTNANLTNANLSNINILNTVFNNTIITNAFTIEQQNQLFMTPLQNNQIFTINDNNGIITCTGVVAGHILLQQLSDDTLALAPQIQSATLNNDGNGIIVQFTNDNIENIDITWQQLQNNQ